MTAQWTFMVYMAGYNNLSEYALDDLGEMRQVGSTDDVKVAVFIKCQDSPRAQRLLVGKGGTGETPEILDVAHSDSGRAQTLIDFIRWARKAAPAARYALVIWNHGGGWAPGEIELLYEEVRGPGTAPGSVARELAVLPSRQFSHILFKNSLASILEEPTARQRVIATDDGTGHSMDTIELDHVLTGASNDADAPLDLLGMDACLMSSLEVAFQVKDLARFIVSSEDIEPGAGWPYTPILQELAANPGMSGGDLSRLIVDQYVASYADGKDSVTQSAIDTSRMTPLIRALRTFAIALRRNLPTDFVQIMKAQKSSLRFPGDLVDIRSFCQAITTGAVSEDLKKTASSLLEVLLRGDCVTANGHCGDAVDGCGGVTIYFPGPLGSISEHYGDLAFAQEASWAHFLRDYAKMLA
jgi:hypothetical protein